GWERRLRALPQCDAVELVKADADLGAYFAEKINDFIREYKLNRIDAIASHGHTVFHDPAKGFSTQIGHGGVMAALTGLPVVCDFRTVDVALGGQGAPIVPIADALFFNEYSYCLNLGGICNVTAQRNKQIVAFDVAPCNQLLNYFARQLGYDYDDKGRLARAGQLHEDVLEKLLALDYHQKIFPKSLDNNFALNVVIPVLQELSKIEDSIRTAVEYIVRALANDIARAGHLLGFDFAKSKILVTGGGAFNDFLVERISAVIPIMLVVPDNQLVKFKEALAIALMGYLRLDNRNNVLKEVTGALKDSVGGCIYNSVNSR
ncbi:MAG: anhydro-N-acetylmuramic acid kinase, partial [Chitinophagales bacterium]|nr:anhydro-N-acetylmuramic acid kinase [Chitinophagales bacterium]